MIDLVCSRFSPEKTFIGRTERALDFLGYHFDHERLSVANKTIERFRERIARLYEQGADLDRIGQYILKLVQSGGNRLKCCNSRYKNSYCI